MSRKGTDVESVSPSASVSALERSGTAKPTTDGERDAAVDARSDRLESADVRHFLSGQQKRAHSSAKGAGKAATILVPAAAATRVEASRTLVRMFDGLLEEWMGVKGLTEDC